MKPKTRKPEAKPRTYKADYRGATPEQVARALLKPRPSPKKAEKPSQL